MDNNKNEIIKIIIKVASNIVGTENDETRFDSNSNIFGENAPFDSLEFVNLIVGVEQDIEENYNMSITLADEKAMSEKENPFKTIGSLADYIVVILDEKLND